MAISLALGVKITSTPGLFINNLIKKGELQVKYCPTGDMIADYFFKPLQGKLFINFLKSTIYLKD